MKWNGLRFNCGALLEELRSYWRWKKPRGYLFPSTAGQRGLDQPISDKTVWHACRTAAKRAGLRRLFARHQLRFFGECIIPFQQEKHFTLFLRTLY
jgi:hypothetical protein